MRLHRGFPCNPKTTLTFTEKRPRGQILDGSNPRDLGLSVRGRFTSPLSLNERMILQEKVHSEVIGLVS